MEALVWRVLVARGRLAAMQLRTEQMVRCLTIFLITIGILFTNAHAAGYIANYSNWQQLTTSQQEGYVMGLWDKTITILAPAQKEVLAEAQGLSKCGADLQLRPEMIISAINEYCRNNTTAWGYNPYFAFRISIIAGACKSYVNETRANYGLTPFN